MCGPLSRGVRTTILAALVLLVLPQTSEAQYFFGRGGAYFGGGFNTPYYGGGFFGPAYGGWGGYGGASSFAYARAYSNSNSYSAAPTIINNNNIYVTPSATNQQPVDPPAIPTPGNKAAIDVVLPADAELWFDGSKTKLTGSVRSFVTPPLTAGTYSYEVRATWKDQSGNAVTRTRLVQITPNQHVVVNLTDLAQETKKSQ